MYGYMWGQILLTDVFRWQLRVTSRPIGQTFARPFHQLPRAPSRQSQFSSIHRKKRSCDRSASLQGLYLIWAVSEKMTFFHPSISLLAEAWKSTADQTISFDAVLMSCLLLAEATWALPSPWSLLPLWPLPKWKQLFPQDLVNGSTPSLFPATVILSLKGAVILLLCADPSNWAISPTSRRHKRCRSRIPVRTRSYRRVSFRLTEESRPARRYLLNT